MELIVHGNNLELSPRLQEYVEKKMDRLDRKQSDIMEARMELSVGHARSADDRQIAQLTLRTERGLLLRAEERASDIFAAIDAVMEKIARQLERYKGRGQERTRQRRRSAAALRDGNGRAGEAALTAEESALEAVDLIVRRKHFKLTPMTEEDAVEQLELLGHPFYLFFNSETKSMNVLYRRGDGTYGTIEPEVAA